MSDEKLLLEKLRTANAALVKAKRAHVPNVEGMFVELAPVLAFQEAVTAYIEVIRASSDDGFRASFD